MQGARGATVYICTIPYIFQDFEVLSRERRFGEVRGVFEEVWSDLIGVDILLFNPGQPQCSLYSPYSILSSKIVYVLTNPIKSV